MKTILLGIVLISLALSAGCNIKPYERGQLKFEVHQGAEIDLTDPDPDGGSDEALNELKDFLIPKCAICHSWIESKEQLLKRIFPGEPEKSRLYILIDRNRMPLGSPALSDKEKEFVFKIISGLKG